MNNKTSSRFIFFAFAMLLLCQGIVMAQSPTAQRDTIYGRNPTYMYQNGWTHSIPYSRLTTGMAMGQVFEM